jgi:hypothetical protein
MPVPVFPLFPLPPPSSPLFGRWQALQAVSPIRSSLPGKAPTFPSPPPSPPPSPLPIPPPPSPPPVSQVYARGASCSQLTPDLISWVGTGRAACVDGPNIAAREAHTVLRFAEEFYNHLPPTVVFTQVRIAGGGSGGGAGPVTGG